MPVPILALAGFSAVVAFFQSVIKEIISYVFTKGFKRLVYFGVFAASIFASLGVFYNKVSGFLSSVLAGMPPEVQMIGYVLPSNTGVCITALVGMEVAGLTYTFVMKTINVKMAAVN